MSVRYTGNGGLSPVYECKGRWEHGSRATCTTVPTPSLDRAIGDRLLEIMQPAQLELALQVVYKLVNKEDDADKGLRNIALEKVGGQRTVFAEARNPDVRLGLRRRNQCCEEIHTIKALPKDAARKNNRTNRTGKRACSNHDR